jgi:hypothetical protein
MSVPAHAVNELIDRLAAARPQPGSLCMIRQTSSGYAINSLDLEDQLIHPWMTTARWDLKKNRWMISVRPGFVNGIDATVPIVDSKNGAVDVPLMDAPEFPVDRFAYRTTPIQQDGPIPAFFKELGASVDRSILVDSMGNISSGENSPNRRCLQSVDIYLSVSRAAINGTTYYTASASQTLQVTYTPKINNAALLRFGTRPRILQTAVWKSQAQMTPLERFYSNSEDIPADELLVATVYLLSPVGVAEGTEADGTWTPFVQHSLFYNLNHAPQRLQPIEQPGDPSSISIDTGLPFADQIGNQLLGQLNDAFNQLRTQLGQTYSLSGLFWTV